MHGTRTIIAGLLIAGLLAPVVVSPTSGQTEGSSEDAPREETAPGWDAPEGTRVTEEGWFGPRETHRPVELPERIDQLFVIPIREEITGKTLKVLKRKLERSAIYARTHGTGNKVVVLDMDTWGGGAIAAMDIARVLKTGLENIYTICYARTRAVSAGALIACAADEIIMTSTGKFGDCAPIAMGQPLEGVRREKIETVLREEFDESARRNGYSPALAKSMVSVDLEVWLIRHAETGELRYVPAESWGDRVRTTGQKKEDEEDEGDEDNENPGDRSWERLRVVVPKGELLTMHPDRAVELGFVEHIVPAAGPEEPLANLVEHLGFEGEPTVLEDMWSEAVFGYLMTPAAMSLLFFAALLCAYVELHTPGLGVPGALALVCLGLLFGGQYLLGMALWWEIALIAVGIVLILLEILVIPGFGVAGVAGGLCLLGGLLGVVVPNAPDKLPIPSGEFAWDLLADGAFALGLGFVLALVAMPIMGRFLPKLPVASRLVIAPSEAAEDAPVSTASPMMRVQVGDAGVVESTCRPVGRVRFGEELLDAVSEGSIIEPGTRVRVLRREGNRLVVEPTE